MRKKLTLRSITLNREIRTALERDISLFLSNSHVFYGFFSVFEFELVLKNDFHTLTHPKPTSQSELSGPWKVHPTVRLSLSIVIFYTTFDLGVRIWHNSGISQRVILLRRRIQ